MPEVIIYHNGECSKSRGALELLIEHNIPHRIRYYLSDPLSEEELGRLLLKLGEHAGDFIRENGPAYTPGELSDSELISILAEHPELMQRPIIELSDRAFIARPPEKVLELLK